MLRRYSEILAKIYDVIRDKFFSKRTPFDPTKADFKIILRARPIKITGNLVPTLKPFENLLGGKT